MKKLITALLLAVLTITLLVTTAQAKPCPWRNKHCRVPTATVTLTTKPATNTPNSTPQPRFTLTPTSTPQIHEAPAQTGTPVYICQSLNCFTPGKP